MYMYILCTEINVIKKYINKQEIIESVYTAKI